MLLELMVGLGLIMMSILLVHHAVVKLTEYHTQSLQLLKATADHSSAKMFPVKIINQQGQLITVPSCNWSVWPIAYKDKQVASAISLSWHKEVA